MRIAFVIPGQLRGKGRHHSRVVKTKEGRTFAHNYPDAATVNHEAMIRSFASKAMGGKPLFEGPVELTVRHFKPHPMSWSKKRKLSSFFVTGKPDASNCIKALEDACNKIVWHDDSQIAKLNYARYFWQGPERTEIEVSDELLYDGLDSTPEFAEVEPLPEPLPLFKRIRRKRVAA